jgi:hypothetical protein
MRNTQAIIEAICNYTTFDNSLKRGLNYLKESNIDIIYWDNLSSREEERLLENSQSSAITLNPEEVKNAFGKFTSSVSGDLVKEKTPEGSGNWLKNNLTSIKTTAPEAKTKSEKDYEAHMADRYKYATPEFISTLDTRGMSQDERIKADIESSKNSYYDLLSSKVKIVGASNIKTYIEKISDDVENFVSLVTYLTDQIVKEAWINSPQKIQSIWGNELYFMENAALVIRGKNIKGFMQESSNVLQLATDVSKYFVLDNANNDIRKSLEEVWPEVMVKSKEKIEKLKGPEPVKAMFAFNEEIHSNFLTALSNAVWESIPSIIKKHGDEFFLIMEDNQVSVAQHDAFNSSQFQSYNPIFETMYYELREKKPFNWLLKLEELLVDDKEIEKNLELCTQALVQEKLSNITNYSYPTVGQISGFTAHKIIQTTYNSENGLGKFLDVRDSLWITSGYVPGTFGLILLLLNVSCAVLFVATAEDIVGFDMSKSYPQFTGLPIWEAFKNGAMDLKIKYEEERKTKKPLEKTGVASPRDAKKTGIKFD